jgi:hypothetical protein
MTQKPTFSRNRKPPPRNPERHRRRTHDDFENELLDDCMAAYPARSHQDFFTRFFNHFVGNPGNQQQCLSILFTASIRTAPPERGWRRFENIFRNRRVRDQTDDNPIAGQVALR